MTEDTGAIHSGWCRFDGTSLNTRPHWSSWTLPWSIPRGRGPWCWDPTASANPPWRGWPRTIPSQRYPDTVVRWVTGDPDRARGPVGAFGHLVDIADVGKPAALLRAARASLARAGAQTQHEKANFDPGAVCMDEKTLLGSYSSSFEILDEVTGLVFGGYRNGFDLTQLISHRFPLEEAVAAIDVASHPKADSMKIMIEPMLGGGAERGGE